MKKIFEDLKNSRSFYSLIGLFTLILISIIIAPNFRTFNNMIVILRQASVLLILSSGLTAVLLTGSMDLSVGATAGFVGCICARCINNGIPIPVAILIGIGIGILVGYINGTLAGLLPSFIATYATNWVMSGLAIMVMNGSVIYNLPKGFTLIGIGYLGPIPILVIIAAAITVILLILLQKTTYGRQVYSYGSNAEAARYSGLPVKKIMMSSFIICSVCAGMAGMIITARLNAADASMGDSYGLQTVAAVVIGGTSMLGGEGGIGGTVVGALILTIIVNVMNLLGVTSFAQSMVVGIVIIMMVLFDMKKKNKQAKAA
jgi:ribose transport system permease protein